MSGPDLNKIPGIVLDGDEPVFNEPWEAQAFAIAVRLHEQGMYTWSEWADTLGCVIREDAGATPYYELWFAALERIVVAKTAIGSEDVAQRKKEWQAALLATPHGKPVELKNAGT